MVYYVIKWIRGGKSFRIILTVSADPLIATASGHHVLTSSTYSKSTLRAIAGLWAEQPFVDYFPSYEIVNNPRLNSTAFSDNLRSVRDESVETIMRHFLKEHPFLDRDFSKSKSTRRSSKPQNNIQCEEALMEAFGK